jgi:hypothetical protein
MTEITYTKTDDYVEIEALGHASTRTACVKISILLQTLSDELCEMLGEHSPSLFIENNPGISHIKVEFKDIGIVHEHDVSLIFDMIIRGLYIVKSQFGDALDIK